ncbi:MAG TPA: YegS/Rv2252/BmrU family lipid kinase [Candidatus Angelobacter sp.]|nr:YegS/Rv2252/BmrU family lipid kinase [Candidatus Angelobacter sp.]
MARPLAALGEFDRRLFERLTRREQRTADRLLKRLSNAANRSVLWLSMAAVLALVGGRSGRRAAARGVVAISLTSTLVNLPLKYLARRDRPRLLRQRPLVISVPGSFSFPSGHSASAFAFTTATALENPRLLPAILPLAAAVAYSRVHLRVHYPLDVVAGAAIGTGMGLASGAVVRGGRRWWEATTPLPEDQRPQTNQLILIVNPHSGRHEKLDQARKAMRAMGLEVVRELSIEELGRLPGLLRPDGARGPIVVAAGGDGTIGAVVNAVVGTDAVVGILPLGTSNDFARSIKIPANVEHAVGLLSNGRITRIDTGRLTADGQAPRHFVHAAATGLNVAFAKFATRADLRRRLGRLTYAVAAAAALRERPVFECDVEHQGQIEHLELVHLSILNAPVFGGFLDLRIPNARPGDHVLHVIMVEHLQIRRLLRSALYPALRLHRGMHGFRTLQVSRLTVRPPHPMDVTLDGEVSGKIPGTFDVVPSALRVIAPLTFERGDR